MPKVLFSHDSNQPIPPSLRGLTYPQNSAAEHPVDPMLIEHAKEGCPFDTGKNRTLKETTAAMERGPHVSAMRPDAMKYAQQESAEKVQGGFEKSSCGMTSRTTHHQTQKYRLSQ